MGANPLGFLQAPGCTQRLSRVMKSRGEKESSSAGLKDPARRKNLPLALIVRVPARGVSLTHLQPYPGFLGSLTRRTASNRPWEGNLLIAYNSAYNSGCAAVLGGA